MSRSPLLRTRRALRFNTLEALEARALLTASPVAVFTNPVILPTVVVFPPAPTSSSDAPSTTSSAASQTGAAPSTSAASAAALNVPSATGSDKVASTSGSSGTSVSGPSGYDPSSGTASDGGNDQQGPLRAELAATEAARDQVVFQIASAEMAIANDKRAIQQNTDVLKAIQARIDGLAAEEATLTTQIDSLRTDYTQDGQMVAAYLKNQLEALQSQQASLANSRAAYQQAIAAAQQQLEFDTGVRDRLKLRLDQLELRIKEINEILAGVV